MKSLEETLHPTDWTLVKKVFPFIRPYWVFYTLAILLAPVSALVAVLQPGFCKSRLTNIFWSGT